MQVVGGFVALLISVSVYALPDHPYAPWRIICLDKTNQTITYPNGTAREILPSETWSAELQNARGLDISSVRCWCMDREQYNWDTECFGAGNGWWTMIKLLSSEGQSCTCPAGQAIMVEMDHNICGGTEGAAGFFQCSGCPESLPDSSSVASASSSTTSSLVAVAGAVVVCACAI